MPDERPGGIDEIGCSDVERFAFACDLDFDHPAAAGFHGFYPAGDEPDAVFSGLLQHVHSHLLSAEPSCAPWVDCCNGFSRDVREVPVNDLFPEEQIRARDRCVEIVHLLGRILVVGVDAVVYAERTCSEPFSFFRRLSELFGFVRIGSGEQVTATIHPEDVPAFFRQLFHQVDAAVHECDHGIVGAGPPVSVAFGGLVAGERQRGTFVHEDHVFDAFPDREVVSSCDSCYPCAAYKDVALQGHDSFLL